MTQIELIFTDLFDVCFDWETGRSGDGTQMTLIELISTDIFEFKFYFMEVKRRGMDG